MNDMVKKRQSPPVQEEQLAVQEPEPPPASMPVTHAKAHARIHRRVHARRKKEGGSAAFRPKSKAAAKRHRKR
jgi:hypothetical protein